MKTFKPTQSFSMNINSNSTIIAEITPAGRAAISLIRLSGNQSHTIAKQILLNKNLLELRQLSWIYDYSKQKIDQVLLNIFHAPNSFTGEDIVEINCHGNPLIVAKIIQTCLGFGAHIAAPGEFTERAFLNGKMDLTQAEAIMDLIQSKSEKLLHTASNQLNGDLRKIIESCRDNLLLCIGLIQGPLDFPIETEEAEINIPQIKKGISEVLPKIETLIKQAHSASILRQGIKAVILGRPNVGKSSLLNLLLSEERAIVSEEAGTTRDFLSEEILIRDIPVKIIDTAGLRDNTESQIEQKGIEKAISLSKQADLILFVYDLIDGWTQEDNNLFDSIKGNNPFAKFVILANKADIANNIYQTEEHSIGKGDKQSKYKENEIKFSTKNSMGLNRLEERIQEILQINSLDGEFEIGINQRQFFLLSSVKESLVKSIEILELKNKSNIAHPTSKGQQVSRINQEPSNLNCETFAEVISIELEEAIKRLGEVIGEKGSITESAVQRVFSNFCIGK